MFGGHGVYLSGTLLFLLCAAGRGRSSDWAAWRADAARSGITNEKLAFPLMPVWRYRPTHPPRPAWPEPGKELHRQDFDYAFQPVAGGGLVYFGSSADDTVRAIEAKTGTLRWRFTAGGPIRFAPALAGGKLYVASDDGRLYCLDAATGRRQWQFQGAPGDDQILGNGRMISRWPLRTGVLVSGGTAYLTAGMWPSQGIFVYALDAATGQLQWRNADTGNMYLDLPHPGASAFTGVSPQGYLALSKNLLLVPTGRSVPAAFERRTGRFRYYQPARSKRDGGAWITVAGDLYFNPIHGSSSLNARLGEAQPSRGDGLAAYALSDGQRTLRLPGKQRVVAAGDVLYAVGGGRVQALNRKAWRSGKKLAACVRWSARHPRAYSLALVQNALLVGGRDSITAYDPASGAERWKAKVEGEVRGLAVSEGRLLAATDRGTILCFEHRDFALAPIEVAEKQNWSAPITGRQVALAAAIVKDSGKTEGYALLLGEADSRLAAALAVRTKLHVINVLRSRKQAEAERGPLLNMGLYGSRVAVQGLEHLERLPFAPYFADLVAVSGNAAGLSGKELYRVLHPYGGVLYFSGLPRARVEALLKEGGVPKAEIHSSGDSWTVVRGKLPGAGEWRWQYADGGRSGISQDVRVRLPLDVLWFGGPGPDRMMDRHWGTSTPLLANGRVFVTGQNQVVSFDAYTGRSLWNRKLQGAGRKGALRISANAVADDASLYVAVGATCYRLDQITGRTLAAYRVPERLAEMERKKEEAALPEVDLEWPKRWQVVGPFPKGAPPLKKEQLGKMPEPMKVQGKSYTPAPLPAVQGFLAFPYLYGGYGFKPLAPGEQPKPYPGEGRKDLETLEQSAYAFAKITCPQAGILTIGAGADWWMQWFLDGKPIYDTLKRGNRDYPYTPRNHVFSAKVSAGEHVLCVMVKAGSKGWCLVSVGGAKYARQLRFVPSGKRRPVWGYLGVAQDLILGSRFGRDSTSPALFALEKESGKVRWIHQTQQRVAGNSIALSGGRVFLLDATPRGGWRRARSGAPAPQPRRVLQALALENGSEVWRKDGVPEPSGYAYDVQVARGVVLVGGGAAYEADTGRLLWEKKVRAQRQPAIRGDWIIAQPYAYDLKSGAPRMAADVLTGERRPWRFARAYGCGGVAGGRNLLFFRSGTIGFFDFKHDGTANFGGVRPNCSISMIAAGGLLIAPESSSGCSCSYNYQTSLALVPAQRSRDRWYVVSGSRSPLPVKHFKLNLGAPGDRREGPEQAWLGWPRPLMSGACPFPAGFVFKRPNWYYHPSETARIGKTKRPWVYSSGLRGQGTIIVDLRPSRPVVFKRCEKPPALDGQFDDPCWKRAMPVPFQGHANLLEPEIELRVCRDETNLYFAYRRKAALRGGKALPFRATQSGADAACRRDDECEIFLTDKEQKRGALFGVSCAGGRLEALRTPKSPRRPDVSWNGAWRLAVKKEPREWRAEIAIPLKTLAEAQINTDALRINFLSQNLSGQGPAKIHLADPGDSRFDRCRNFRRLANQAPASPERTFTVRLHFAELDKNAAGQRRFHVKLQGRFVLKDFNILKEAGTPRRALVKEFKGIQAKDELSITLLPAGGANGGEGAEGGKDAKGSEPLLCGIEAEAEVK